MEEAIRRLTKVFGVHSVCRAVEMEKTDFSAIQTAAVELLRNTTGTFKVESRRSDKRYFMDSPAINIEIGHFVLEHLPNLKVDVHRPQTVLSVEIRDKAYLYTQPILAVGGMPVGTNGRATFLLSGGIDSPVAGWMIAKRGVSMKILLENIIYQPEMDVELRTEFLTDVNREINRLNLIISDLLTLVSMRMPIFMLLISFTMIASSLSVIDRKSVV